MGDPIAANMFMLGVAWQHGWIPVSLAAILRAIELNNVAVEFNQQCFQWGRRAAYDRAGVLQRVAPVANVVSFTPCETVGSIVQQRAAFLTAYQDAALANRYRSLVDRVAQAERNAAWLIGCRARLHCITSSCWRSRTSGRSRGFTARPSSGASSKPVRRRFPAALSSRCMAIRPYRSGHRRNREGRGGPVGVAGVSPHGPSSALARISARSVPQLAGAPTRPAPSCRIRSGDRAPARRPRCDQLRPRGEARVAAREGSRFRPCARGVGHGRGEGARSPSTAKVPAVEPRSTSGELVCN